jgi:hypothetical protein
VTVVIGLSVEHDHLRAVGVRGVRVVWGMESAVVRGTLLNDALAGFLTKLPLGRFGRPRLTVALAPAFAQTKLLAGVPPLSDVRALERAVSEHAARFFLKNGIPLVTTSVRRDAEGRVWGAALQKPVVDRIVTACRASRVRLAGIVPAADVSRGATDALTPLGAEAAQFGAAYGAAVLSDALTWRAGASAPEDAPRWRLMLIAGGAALALIAAALAPALAWRVSEHRAVVHLARMARQSQSARRLAHDVELVTEALNEVGAFDSGRRPVTLLMASLAGGLPDGAALLALHVDSSGGSIVALAPRGGALLTRLERVSGVAAPEIIGPVTRETPGGREVERVTVRFRWRLP